MTDIGENLLYTDMMGRPKLPMHITKAKKLLSIEDINFVSSHICYKLNCVQPFPRKKILAV